MPDLRFDPISEQWVAIASNRNDRPMEFAPASEYVSTEAACPFCAGNENETPPELELWDEHGNLIEGAGDSAAWLSRVVPNKFPSFPARKLVRPYETTVLEEHGDNGPFESSRLSGVQELIIPSPRHICSFSELTEQEARVGLISAQNRLSVLAGKHGIKHGMLFMNCRAAAGASLSHIHLQLIGSPVISAALRDRVARNSRHAEEHGTSLISTIVQWEQTQRRRIVSESEHFTVLCPFASRVPFQTWIVPKHSQHKFSDCPAVMRDELADLCRNLLTRLESLQNELPYNILLHAAPFELSQNDHWYFEIQPRLTSTAGLELGTDVWVNPVSPEDSARKMR